MEERKVPDDNEWWYIRYCQKKDDVGREAELSFKARRPAMLKGENGWP